MHDSSHLSSLLQRRERALSMPVPQEVFPSTFQTRRGCGSCWCDDHKWKCCSALLTCPTVTMLKSGSATTLASLAAAMMGTVAGSREVSCSANLGPCRSGGGGQGAGEGAGAGVGKGFAHFSGKYYI